MNIVVINRRFYGWNWSATKTNYRSVINHHQHQVTYLVDGKSRCGLHTDEIQAAHVIELASLDKTEQVKDSLRALHAITAIDRIIALNEEDILTAAQMRDELDIPGVREKALARFRNKMLMKEILQQQQIAVPEFAPATHVNDIVNKSGFPIVLKPLDGASSKGVKIVCDEQELQAALKDIGNHLTRYEAEQFISGSIYHLDGFMNDQKIVFCQVYQYYNSCYAFANGAPVGVMMVDDPHQKNKLTTFAEQSLAALDLPDGPFHLELFNDLNGDVRFLEVGARVGGAFVAPCIEKRWGINMFEEDLHLQMEGALEVTRLQNAQPADRLYGWLLFPVPKQDCHVESIEFPEQTSISGILEAKLPTLHEPIDQSGGYIHTGGTFLIEGNTQHDQLNTIKEIIARYRVIFSKPMDVFCSTQLLSDEPS